MTNGISQETKNILNGIDELVAFDKLWKNIKDCNQDAINPKFGTKSKVVIPYISTNLVVKDTCCINNANVYLLEYENNYAYKLIVLEDCISKVQ